MANKKKDIVKATIGSVTLHDTGKMPEKYPSLVACTSKAKQKVYYPCLYIDSKQAPSLKGCDVDDEITLVVKAKVIGHNLNESKDYSSDEYRLEIQSLGVANSDEGKE